MSKLMFDWLNRWLKRPAAIEAAVVDDLIAAEGEQAYAVARERARAVRSSDTAAFKYWSAVAVLIADKAGREVGVKAADRYARDADTRRSRD